MVGFEWNLWPAKGELDFRCLLVFAFVLLCTRNRENKSYLLFLSSVASSIGPFGAFARLRFCISASTLLRCYIGCSVVEAVAVQLLYRGNNRNTSSRLQSCLSHGGDRRKYSACRRGDSEGKEMPYRLNWLQWSIHVLQNETFLLIDSKTDSNRQFLRNQAW